MLTCLFIVHSRRTHVHRSASQLQRSFFLFFFFKYKWICRVKEYRSASMSAGVFRVLCNLIEKDEGGAKRRCVWIRPFNLS